MTTANRAEAGRKLIPNLWIVGTSAVLGAAFGFVAFFAVLSVHEALGIVQIGRVPNALNSNASTVNSNGSTVGILIEDPNVLVERLRSKSFARVISERLHDQRLEMNLPATQYGGKGAVRSRLLRDSAQVEVRIQAGTDNEAIEVLRAIFAELTEEHKKLTEGIFDLTRRWKEEFQKRVDRAAEFQQLIDSQIAARVSGNLAENSFLMAVRDQSMHDMQTTSVFLKQIELFALPPFAQETRVTADPAIGQPILSTPWHTAALGLIAGVAFGLALVQMWRIVSS